MNPTIDIGDTVRILPRYHSSVRCQGHTEKDSSSDQIGIVVRKHEYHSHELLVRYLPFGNYSSWLTAVPLKGLSLLAKGDGEAKWFFEGRGEAMDRQRAEHQAKLDACDVSHQGFSNAATFLACLYINNDARALAEVQSFQRKDGTVNPNKVNKLFHRRGFVIDAWAYESPIKTPEALEGVQFRLRSNINWQEVANEFKREDTQ